MRFSGKFSWHETWWVTVVTCEVLLRPTHWQSIQSMLSRLGIWLTSESVMRVREVLEMVCVVCRLLDASAQCSCLAAWGREISMLQQWVAPAGNHQEQDIFFKKLDGRCSIYFGHSHLRGSFQKATLCDAKKQVYNKYPSVYQLRKSWGSIKHSLYAKAFSSW